MARSFNGSTDKITTGNVTHFTVRSYSAWFYPTTIDSTLRAIWMWIKLGTGGGDPNDYLLIANGSGNVPAFIAGWTGSGFQSAIWTFGGTIPTVNAWNHYGVTYDGGSTSNDPIVYLNGTSLTVTRFAAPSGTLLAGDVPIVFGNEDDVAAPFAGRIAEFCQWNATLTADELVALSRRLHPRRIRPASIKSYFPLWGLQSPEPELSGKGNSGTLSGTSLAGHAPVTLWTRRSVSDPTRQAQSWTRTAAEAPTVAESVVRAGGFLRSPTDAPVVAESLTRGGVFLRIAGDAPQTAESVVRVASEPRTTTEGPTVAESVVHAFVGARAATDAPQTSESAARAFAGARTTTDAPTVAESLAQQVAVTRSASDAPAMSEAVTRLLIGLRATTDTLQIAESMARLVDGFRTATDAPQVAEAVARVFAGSRSITDTPLLLESMSRQFVGLRTTADAPAVSESAVAQTDLIVRSAVDATTVAESVGRMFVGTRSVTEAFTLSDVATADVFRPPVTRQISVWGTVALFDLHGTMETAPAVAGSVGTRPELSGRADTALTLTATVATQFFIGGAL